MSTTETEISTEPPSGRGSSSGSITTETVSPTTVEAAIAPTMTIRRRTRRKKDTCRRRMTLLFSLLLQPPRLDLLLAFTAALAGLFPPAIVIFNDAAFVFPVATMAFSPPASVNVRGRFLPSLSTSSPFARTSTALIPRRNSAVLLRQPPPPPPPSLSSLIAETLPATMPTLTVPYSRGRMTFALTVLSARRIGADMEVSFGSSEAASAPASSSAAGEEDFDDEDESDVDYRRRQERVNELLKESEAEFRAKRKAAKWGRFANVTDRRQLQPVLDREREKIRDENRRKADTAKRSGVSFTVLEPKDDDERGAGDSSVAAAADAGSVDEVWDTDATGKAVRIRPGSAAASRSWFSEMDDDLAEEWKALMSSSEEDGEEDGEDGKEAEEDEDGDLEGDGGPAGASTDAAAAAAVAAAVADAVQLDEGTGKVVTRDALSGVRVGSAAGWSLEVFPGDFVVHRKYGIGRFERTCIRPKTRLSAEEKRARDERRAELLREELERRKEDAAAGGSKKNGRASITAEEISRIRARFGTSDDVDPVSNPQQTVLEIAYQDAVVHVPVDRAYRLSRYRAANAAVKPRLSRCRSGASGAWARAKERVRENTLQIAQDVLALYATRETLTRPPSDPAREPAVKAFAETFPFTPTPDQLTCFEDVENDMVWKRRPMDRLVCGDVGFGKTEVAMRALFRAVANDRQAAFLAPTGVLAAQHYKTLQERMGPFNVTTVLLRGGTGGKNTKAGRAILEQIATGGADIVVGTHALLSKDVAFSDLALLVVDEEQRFGVKQKERLKLISKGVDVLTLSATPIPRTLQMSLSGIRDTSSLRSPPPMRKPTVTYVQEFSDEIVESAIARELDRGGQCYYVVPRIAQLAEAEKLIRRLFPGIRVVSAHGRMHRNGAEENVAAFAEGLADVLLATTVIENGVDIPTVNTIVVQNSQAFGMSTLYQLRGRVGRSDVQAAAYFLHKPEAVTEQAVQRLTAIRELSELGSGFDVANRDLEIRGAGSLLGTEQSGMAARVGFDLYMRMLKKSMRQLRGLDLPAVPRTNCLLPVTVVGRDDDTGEPLRPDTFRIPASFIPDDGERRREETKARLAESTAALVQLTARWKERYGNLPAPLQRQLKTMHLHACSRRLGIDLIGLVDGDGGVEGASPRVNCVLRSPGLRPRHWAAIAETLPSRGIPGLDIVFPSRFLHARGARSPGGSQQPRKELEIAGGRKMAPDLKELLFDPSLDEDREEEEWDAMDEEDREAARDISSAANVRSMDEVDLERYPRFVIRDMLGYSPSPGDGGNNYKKQAPGSPIDRLLRALLPISKAAYEIQERQAEEARVASDLRKKQDLLRSRKKVNEAREAQRLGYRY